MLLAHIDSAGLSDQALVLSRLRTQDLNSACWSIPNTTYRKRTTIDLLGRRKATLSLRCEKKYVPKTPRTAGFRDCRTLRQSKGRLRLQARSRWSGLLPGQRKDRFRSIGTRAASTQENKQFLVGGQVLLLELLIAVSSPATAQRGGVISGGLR